MKVEKRKNVDRKRGITMLILVITIILILILASAIIVTLTKTDPVDEAEEAVLKSDMQAMKDEYELRHKDLLFENFGDKTKLKDSDFEDIIPDKYKNDFTAGKDGVEYTGEDEKIKDIAEEMGIGKEKGNNLENIAAVADIDSIEIETIVKDKTLVKEYHYYIREKDTNEWNQYISNKNTYLVDELKENTAYEVKVKIVGKDGEEEISQIKEIATKELNLGYLIMRENDKNGNEYHEGFWTKENLYVAISGENTTYTCTGANEIGKTDKENVLEKEGITKVIVETKVGVNSVKKEYEIKIDKSVPTINSLTVNTANASKNLILTAKAKDELSGIVAYQFSTDGNLTANSSGWEEVTNIKTEMTQTYEVNENGFYYFYVKDEVGNMARKEIEVLSVDKEAPTLDSIVVTSPNSGTYKSGQTVTMEARYSENVKGTAPVLKIKFGTGAERTVTAGVISENKITYTYKIASGDNGDLVSTSYIGKISDIAGNEITVESKALTGSSIIADTTPPSNAVPVATSNTNSITAILKQTDSGSGINNKTIQYAIKKVSDSTWGAWITSNTASYTFSNLTMNTSYEIKTRVSDNVGNTSESEVITRTTRFISKPNISAPTEWTKENVVVTITYPSIAETTRQYSTNGTTWTNVSGTTQSVTVSTNNTTVYARVIDSTNQTGGTATHKVTCIDRTAPATASLSAGGVNNKTVTITARGSDSQSGVESYSLYVNGKLISTVSTTTISGSMEYVTFKYTTTFGSVDAYVIATDRVGNTKQSSTITIKDNTIKTLAELKTFRDSVNAGNNYQGETITQIANINLGGSANGNWEAIGKQDAKFNGIYNGSDYEITGLYAKYESDLDIGLFGATDTEALIKNLTIELGSISSQAATAGMAVGDNYGAVENIKVRGGNVQIGKHGGGIVGLNHTGSRITSCYNSASISYPSTAIEEEFKGWAMGGIVGYNSGGNLLNNLNEGNVTGTHNVGGITGENLRGGIVNQCVNTARILANADYQKGSAAGGIVGINAYTEKSSVLNSYNTGEITAGDHTGGIVGYELSVGSASEVKNCYNIGNLTSYYNQDGIGGIVGNRAVSDQAQAIYSNNYWLSSCGAKYGVGGAVKNNDNATPKSANELKAMAGTLGSAFKADTNNINGGYPILSWQ